MRRVSHAYLLSRIRSSPKRGTQMSITRYKVLHPDAPTVATKSRQKQSEHSKGLWADRKRLLAEAWRPKDWDDKPIDWRIIATELFSKPRMSNEELAERLDTSRIFGQCPYGPNWKVAMKEKNCSEFIRKIRVWVKRPGKVQASAA
jgi:hypothetical protein